MPSIGVPELLVVLMILIVVFGGARLPQIGDALGRAARSLKRGLASDDRIDVRPSEAGAKLTPAPKPQAKSNEDVDEAEIVDRKS